MTIVFSLKIKLLLNGAFVCNIYGLKKIVKRDLWPLGIFTLSHLALKKSLDTPELHIAA